LQKRDLREAWSGGVYDCRAEHTFLQISKATKKSGRFIFGRLTRIPAGVLVCLLTQLGQSCWFSCLVN